MSMGKFAVVRLWPNVENAESECSARLKIAAQDIGCECIEMTSDGYCVKTNKKLTQDDVDFAIHLHFETPKAYNIFSFVALWNPLQFYFQWGYEKYSQNLLTHDDFLSCQSSGADDHINRLIWNDPLHLSPDFTMFHSLSSKQIMAPIKNQQRKLFYVGINWDRLGKGKTRHQELLNSLDKTGLLSIYGPEVFQGVKIWKGYKSYVKEIPFDGISIVREINKTGIALVLSSAAHKESELMSNRLFESLAAGAVIICDENPFAKKYFGDTLLYIDTTEEDDFKQIMDHVTWINNNPDKATELALKAQKIFKEHFTLDQSLKQIYASIEQRKQALTFGIDPGAIQNPKVRLLYILMDDDKESIDSCIQACSQQDYVNKDISIVIDAESNSEGKIIKKLEYYNVNCDFIKIENFPVLSINNIGRVISQAIHSIMDNPFEYLVIMTSDEQIFSNHIASLVRIMKKNPEYLVGATCELLRHATGDKVLYDAQNSVSFGGDLLAFPIGFAKFIFSKELIDDKLFCLLPYLNKKALAAFIGDNKVIRSPLATVITNIQRPFFHQSFDAKREDILINDIYKETDNCICNGKLTEGGCDRFGRLAIFLRAKVVDKPMPMWLRKWLRKIYSFMVCRK